jgi:hypothetical protein
MKPFRPKYDRLSQQPFYTGAEIESICVDALQKVDLLPSGPSPIRIDRFIEKWFEIQPLYEELPHGLLGFTRFGAKGVEEIVVSRVLDEAATRVAERRVRTTLAHESGHGLLHAHLFAHGPRPDSLFREELAFDAPKILCRDGGIFGIEPPTQATHPYRWWEFQANQAMSVLLLPKLLVSRTLKSVLVTQGMLATLVLPPGKRDTAIALVASTFDVNPVVAGIRLEKLYPPVADQQLTL